MDDLLVFLKSFDQHVKHVKEVFDALRQARLRFLPSKCSIGQSCWGICLLRPGSHEIWISFQRTFPSQKALKSSFLGMTYLCSSHSASNSVLNSWVLLYDWGFDPVTLTMRCMYNHLSRCQSTAPLGRLSGWLLITESLFRTMPRLPNH